jgi:polyisoprenoid-binding protein YceI
MIGLGSLYGASYNVDAGHSDIGFKVKHMMISNVKGNFEKFSGTFTIDEKTKKFSEIEGIVEVASLTTQDAKRDGHLKSADFFDAQKFPQMHLKLIEQHGNDVKMQLTIKDVTKIIDMELEEVSGTVKDPWGYTRMAFELHGAVNRKDFHISFNQLLETGVLIVGDKIKMDIIIEGIQTK